MDRTTLWGGIGEGRSPGEGEGIDWAGEEPLGVMKMFCAVTGCRLHGHPFVSGHIRVHLSKDQVQVPLKAFRPVLVGAPEVGVSLEVGECCLKMCQERGQGEGPATRGPLGPLSSFSSFPPVQKLLDPTRLPEQHSSSLSP